MGVLAIALNDVGLCAARSGADGLLAVDGDAAFSPGYAWRRDGRVVTGIEAARRAILDPRAVHNRFWDLCDTGPLDARDPRSPNRAEVACAHLETVLARARPWEEDVVIVTPPFYDKTQLGILVAMAGEIGLPLRGLVPGPLAVAAEAETNDAALIVELFLHRCVLSVVTGGERIAVGPTRTVAGAGLDVYRRRWIRSIADAFVRGTRFDPLHDAVTEQQLHDDLPAILDAVAASGGHEVELASGSGTHRASISDRMLADAGHELTSRIGADIRTAVVANAVTAIRVEHEMSRVPGLMAMLGAQTAVPVSTLSPGAPALGLVRAWPDRFDVPAASDVAYYTSGRS